ncbi:hypothetical protein [Acinetobacter sp. WU_MDCI_Abxb74]|uniref:hypothetical protein n=1 Tax=Acinetobacter sp. WU_MDCI_Abxb74 TaxID=2850072 RepID=UPI0021CDB638|nr:hypothetical protein [Acinetobacter sp. WU_MDCI_Abxb74]
MLTNTHQDYLNKITKILENLEEKGEIMILSSSSEIISKLIIHSIAEETIEKRLESDFIIECDTPYLLETISSQLSSIFKEDKENSDAIVNQFYHNLLRRLNMQQVAELLHHEGAFEIALRSYYSIKLGNADYLDLNYLDWRKQYYSQLK